MGVGVFCTTCGRVEVGLEDAVAIVYWDGTAEYQFECPRCEVFRTVPAGSRAVNTFLLAGCDVVVEPVDGSLLEAAAAAWAWEFRS